MLLAAAAASVCLAQPSPPVPSHSARLIVQTGRVSVWGDNGEQALFQGAIVQPRQMIVTGPDGYAQFQVTDDGSTFEVFPNSKLIFHEHVPNWTDLLDVVIGRVKIYIQHLNGAPNPNRVSSPTAIISVRGTIFDVCVEDDDGTTVVSVDEGIVDVQNYTAPGKEVSLTPGESVRVVRNQRLAARPIDRAGAMQKMLRVASDIWYQILLRRGGGAGPIPGGGVPGPAGGGANGDKGKGGGATAPGAPGSTGGTSAPGAPGPPK
jgi:hypothetical protein